MQYPVAPSPPETAVGNALPAVKPSAADYLAWEQAQTMRHEFRDGEIFAMAGAEERHVTVSGNVYMALRQHLRGSTCRTFVTDMRLWVADANCYFYPDVFVTCSAQDTHPLQKEHPRLVVEVLSPSTAAHDRGAKFAAYRRASSLLEYVLVDPDARTTDVYRRGADGLWVLHPFGPDDTVHFASVELALPPDTLWADVPAADGSTADDPPGGAAAR